MQTQTNVPYRYHEQITNSSADERKKRKKIVLEGPNPLRRRINAIDKDGNESIGFHSHHGTAPCGFISI
jgi:hypothetical protein